MKKFNLNSASVLNKKFGVELSGYNATEVDRFLDLVLDDYRSYEELIKHLDNQLSDKTKLVNDKESEIDRLKLQLEVVKDQLEKTGKATNIELLEEVRRLRREFGVRGSARPLPSEDEAE